MHELGETPEGVVLYAADTHQESRPRPAGGMR